MLQTATDRDPSYAIFVVPIESSAGRPMRDRDVKATHAIGGLLEPDEKLLAETLAEYPPRSWLGLLLASPVIIPLIAVVGILALVRVVIEFAASGFAASPRACPANACPTGSVPRGRYGSAGPVHLSVEANRAPGEAGTG